MQQLIKELAGVNSVDVVVPVLPSEGASQAFLTALFETASQYDWKLHAYVLMRNHYHLVLETEKGKVTKNDLPPALLLVKITEPGARANADGRLFFFAKRFS